jgi:hypothetical protein
MKKPSGFEPICIKLNLKTGDMYTSPGKKSTVELLLSLDADGLH